MENTTVQTGSTLTCGRDFGEVSPKEPLASASLVEQNVPGVAGHLDRNYQERSEMAIVN